MKPKKILGKNIHDGQTVETNLGCGTVVGAYQTDCDGFLAEIPRIAIAGKEYHRRDLTHLSHSLDTTDEWWEVHFSTGNITSSRSLSEAFGNWKSGIYIHAVDRIARIRLQNGKINRKYFRLTDYAIMDIFDHYDDAATSDIVVGVITSEKPYGAIVGDVEKYQDFFPQGTEFFKFAHQTYYTSFDDADTLSVLRMLADEEVVLWIRETNTIEEFD